MTYQNPGQLRLNIPKNNDSFKVSENVHSKNQFEYNPETVRNIPSFSGLNANEIFMNMHDQLEKFVKSKISSPVDAEDLIQDIFIKIHEKVCTIRDDSKVAVWVFSIARNAIIDFYRKRRYHTELLDDRIASESDDFVENKMSSFIADGVRLIVEILPEKYRTALLKTEYEGISQIQVAKELGLNISTVKSRVQRGRARLKELLLEFCHIEFDRYGTIIDCYPTACNYCKELKK